MPARTRMAPPGLIIVDSSDDHGAVRKTVERIARDAAGPVSRRDRVGRRLLHPAQRGVGARCLACRLLSRRRCPLVPRFFQRRHAYLRAGYRRADRRGGRRRVPVSAHPACSTAFAPSYRMELRDRLQLMLGQTPFFLDYHGRSLYCKSSKRWPEEKRAGGNDAARAGVCDVFKDGRGVSHEERTP